MERDKRDVGREVAGDFDVAQLGAAYTKFTSPSASVMRREEIERLEGALERMTPEHREVLTLAHLAGLSRKEIAEQIGSTEEAVRAMLHRAMARLSLLLEGGA